MIETNKEKGDNYEIQTRNHIIDVQKKRAYLWHHTPETLLIQNGIIGSHNQRRLRRKYNKLNSLQDTGIDIVIDNNENEHDHSRPCSIVQCKNGYKEGILMEHLAGFIFWCFSLPLIQGYVYYNSKISRNITELPKNDRITYLKLPYCTQNTDPEKGQIDHVTNHIDPYPYQILASRAFSFSDFHRGILSLPCGTGKTLTSYIISNKYKQIILISPLRQFAKQNLDRFIEYGFKNSVLLIDSDGERDVDNVIEFIKNNPSFLLSCTFKSTDVIWKIMNYLDDKNVLIIVDEFHNLSLANISDEEDYFYKILNSDNKILFMSATPRIYELEEKNIDCYCSETVFGEILYKMSFNEAIEKKYITDYRIWLPSISENIDDLLQELGIYDIDNVVKSKCIYFFACLLKNGSRKCIIYCTDNDEICAMMEAMNQLNDYYCMDYEMNKINAFTHSKSRESILQQFQFRNDHIQLLFSIRILDECIDVPSCDSIFITYPSQSKIRTIQRLCRCIRIDKKNPFKVGNVYIWCNQYDEILTTLAGLKEYDATFRDKIKLNVVDFYGKTQSVELVLQDTHSIKEYFIGVKEFKEVAWDQKLEALRTFFEMQEKRPTCRAEDKTEKVLGNWISTQLHNREKCRHSMSNEKIRDLWDAFKTKYGKYFKSNEEIWHDKLAEVKSFFEMHDKRPSQTAKNETEKVLAKWISHQLNNREKCKDIMSNENIRDNWDAFKTKYGKYLKSNEEIWRDKLAELETFFEKHEKRPSNEAKNKTEKVLATWISTQIENREKSQQILSNEKIRDLWDAFKTKFIKYFKSSEDIWRDKLAEVKSFFEMHDKRPACKAKNKTEKVLATWISNQIKNREKCQQIMSNENIRDLWDAFKTKFIKYFKSNEEIWRDKLAEVKSFFKIHDKRPSTIAKDETEKVLAIWISTQLYSREKCQYSMSNENIRNLWDVFKTKFIKSNEEIWSDKLAELESFFEMHEKRPAQKVKNEKEKVLGSWISNQLQNREKCQCIMSNEKIRNLWDAFKTKYGKYLKSNEEIWRDKLDEVESFFEIHDKRPSHGAKNETEKELATWISTQLQNRENSQCIMSNKKIRDLWDAFKTKYIKYLKSNKEIWRDKLAEVESFFEMHDKRPACKAKNETEKVLSGWISTQIKNREKCQQIMSDERIRNLWDAFKTKYGKYFKFDQGEEEKPFFEIKGKRPLDKASDEAEGDAKRTNISTASRSRML